jgi:hypothetical protein
MQKLVLSKILKARTTPPTVISLCWPVVPMLLVVGGLSLLVLVALGMPGEINYLAVGMYLGAALTYFGVARKTIRVWPIFLEIYNWPKIEAMAAAESGRVAERS